MRIKKFINEDNTFKFLFNESYKTRNNIKNKKNL